MIGRVIWQIGWLRWQAGDESSPISWNWKCLSRRLVLIIPTGGLPWYVLIFRLHWHEGLHDACEPGWPRVRIRRLEFFGWSPPFIKSYTA